MSYLALRHATIKITPHGLNRQFQETESIACFLETFFMIFKGRFPRIKSPETTHSKKIIKICLRKNCHIK